MQLCESVLLITFLLHSILVPNIHWIINDKAIAHLYHIFMVIFIMYLTHKMLSYPLTLWVVNQHSALPLVDMGYKNIRLHVYTEPGDVAFIQMVISFPEHFIHESIAD